MRFLQSIRRQGATGSGKRSKMSTLARTSEVFTAGIVNVPLTKPAVPFFIFDKNDTDKISKAKNVFESMKIPYYVKWSNKKIFIEAFNEVPYKSVQVIYHNNKLSLRPKFISQYRYLFYELDTTEQEIVDNVLAVYTNLNLPVYAHRTMRGYHFLSVYPIPIEDWKIALTGIRDYNPAYPPITLRIKPNKYIGEDALYKEGFILSKYYHSDTQQLRNYMCNQNIAEIEKRYFVVYYKLDGSGDVVA